MKMPVRKFKLWSHFATATAAAVAVILCGIIFFKNDSNKTKNSQANAYVNDVPPGKSGATLTLANGKKILINDALEGSIASQSGVKISKTADGQIVYTISGKQSSERAGGGVQYNTLSTTRGEQTQVRLPDGTLVFLNAESSLRFPTSFAKLEKRQVSLTGEGYFEVAKDKNYPFIVKTANQEIAVLGTHFNINAYSDEENTQTTLVEGSVKVSSLISKGEIILKPGQQSALDQNNIQVSHANLDEALAWKNGEFRFDDKSIDQIMKQIARWYDMSIVFDEQLSDVYLNGFISRKRKLSQVLKMMEKTKEVKFKVDGRIIHVEKYN